MEEEVVPSRSKPRGMMVRSLVGYKEERTLVLGEEGSMVVVVVVGLKQGLALVGSNPECKLEHMLLDMEQGRLADLVSEALLEIPEAAVAAECCLKNQFN